MSALASMTSSRQEGKPAPAVAPAVAKPGRQRHTPGGARLGREASREAQRLAAVVLEVLAGARTPSQAAEAVGVSLPRYFQLETRALRALVAGCEERPRGPRRGADRELLALRRQHDRLQRELSRHQALVRLAQRTIGLVPVKPETDKPGQKRRRRPVVRALRAAVRLQERASEEEVAPAPAAAATAAAST